MTKHCSRHRPLGIRGAFFDCIIHRVVYACVFLVFVLMAHLHLVPIATTTISQQRRKPKFGDDCYHIFLDVGANLGVHSRFLFEPEKYPNAIKAQSVFDKEFGARRNNSDLCAFAFEPNPAHKSRHEKLANAYRKFGWRYHFIQAAVSDTKGNVTFYHNNDESNEEWGFGDHLRRGSTNPETVSTVRLSTWISDEILGRMLPESVYGEYSQPKVVMKMDIESLEFAVLPDLMYTGVLCNTVDVVFGELHGFKIDYNADEETGRGGLHVANGIPMMRESLKLLHSVKDCMATFLELDDESYLHDGVPFP